MTPALAAARPWRPLVLMLPLVLAIALAVSSLDRLAMVVLAVAPLLAVLFLNVELGVYLLLGFATIVAFLKRMMPGLDVNQVGLALEGMLLLMGLRLMVDLLSQGGWRVFRTPATWPLVAFLAYQALEIMNPLAPSVKFGLYGMRDALRMLGVFVVLYYFRSPSRVQRLAGLWLAVLVMESLYGIFQHHHGLLNQEYNWLIDSGSWRTHILDGYVRIFGTVGDAATFGFLMLTGALLLFGVALGRSGWRMVLPVLLAAPMLYALVLSYSRGPIVALVAGLAAMLVASRNYRLALGAALVASLCLGGLALGGQQHLLDRVMTAARPGEDASFQVRMNYLNDYLPRIAERPFGSGLWTTGASGLAVTGGTALPGTTIGIPTDNNYFKYALELGPVGVGIFLWLTGTLLLSTYRTYRRLTTPRLRGLALGLLGVFTAYAVGALSNDIYVQKPLAEWFYVAIGLALLLGQAREIREVRA